MVTERVDSHTGKHLCVEYSQFAHRYFPSLVENTGFLNALSSILYNTKS